MRIYYYFQIIQDYRGLAREFNNKGVNNPKSKLFFNQKFINQVSKSWTIYCLPISFLKQLEAIIYESRGRTIEQQLAHAR